MWDYGTVLLQLRSKWTPALFKANHRNHSFSSSHSLNLPSFSSLTPNFFVFNSSHDIYTQVNTHSINSPSPRLSYRNGSMFRVMVHSRLETPPLCLCPQNGRREDQRWVYTYRIYFCTYRCHNRFRVFEHGCGCHGHCWVV